MTIRVALSGLAGLMVLHSVAAVADVGVSIQLGQPGFFGRIDLGDAPPPALINPSPVIIERPAGAPLPPPVYLHVRPGYERHWRRHCHEYNACGEPVYFVRDDWYNNTYVPHYRERHRDHDEHREGRRDPGDHRDHDDRHDEEHRDHPDDRHRP
jgi:hypothetical protein